MAKSRYRQTVYLDEHIDPQAKELFEGQGLRAIRIAESRYRAKDEHHYIGDLYAEGAVFVTSDQEFVEHAVDERRRHAGINWIPATLLRDEKQMVAAIVAGWLTGADLRQMKNIVLYLAHDGLHAMRGDQDELVYSMHQLRLDLNEMP